jgi:hypothetical protein
VNDYKLSFESGLKTVGVEDKKDFIRPEMVHRAIFQLHAEPPITSRAQNWKLDDVISKINLACFAWQLREWVDGTTDKTWNELLALDATFPGFFLSSFIPIDNEERVPSQPGWSHMLESTFDLAVEIRTQLAIMSLERKQPDLDELSQKLRDAFYNEADSEAGTPNPESLAIRLRTWETEDLGVNLPNKFTKLILRRIKEIESRFPDEDFQGNHDYLSKLQAQYPWSEFILKALQWIRLRSEEVSRSIEYHGGSDHIIALIAHLKEILRPEPVVAEDSP